MNSSKFLLLLFLIFVPQIIESIQYKLPRYVYDLDACDIDHDGDIDIIIGSNDQGNDTISLLINDGFGIFTKLNLERSNYASIICSCIDEDSLSDIVTLNHLNSSYVFYPNLGGITFGDGQIIYYSIDEFIKSFILDEYNSNDFIIYKLGPEGSLGVLLNNGVGVFNKFNIYSSSWPLSEPDVGDLNGDTLNDIIIRDSHVGALIFYNQGGGIFSQQLLDTNPPSYTYIFDIDNDSDNDIGLYQHTYGPTGKCKLRIFENKNNINHLLTDTILFPTGTLFKAFTDFNNDNYFDIVYIRSYWREALDSLYIVFNNQNLTFSSSDRYFVKNPGPIRVVTGDFDGNSYQDIAYSGFNWQDTIVILYNDGTGKFTENPITNIYNPKKNEGEIIVAPNPFNGRTSIRIIGLLNSHVFPSISIYNIQGQLVNMLPRNKIKISPNGFEFEWDGKNNEGSPCLPGIYLCQIISEQQIFKTKILLLE